jgi:DNA-binding NtrC family response regulator
MSDAHPFNPSKNHIVRVFVVDDDQVVASTLAAILHHAGFAAISFLDSLKAIEAATADAPDLLISDVVMPAISGIELAIRILRASPDCKVLLLSGHAHAVELLQEARALGHGFKLLSKPAHPEDLLAEIYNL